MYSLSTQTSLAAFITMSDEKITLPKLAADGSNWTSYRDRLIWGFNMRRWSAHLTSMGTPAAYTLDGDINGVSADDRWANEEAIAMDMIAASVPDPVFNRIKANTTTMEFWNAIKDIYQSRSKMITVVLGKKLQNTKLEEDEDARAHFTKLSDLREQLASMGKNYDDDEYASILLGSLPSSYEPTISAINAAAYLSNTTVTPNGVIRLVTRQYDRRVIRKDKTKSGPEEALAVNGQRKDRRNVECHNCHRKGHYKSECWAKGGDKEGHYPPKGGGNNNNRSNHNNGISNNHNQDRKSKNWNDGDNNRSNRNNTRNNSNPPQTAYSAGQFILQPRPQPEVEVELYSSGASRHMSPFQQRFTNYRSIPPRGITAANKQVFYAVGTGDLQIDVPNENATTPVVLRDTLHVPEIAFTIVSIGRITSTGNTVTFENQSCKIKNKAGKIIGDIPTSSNGLYKVEHAHVASAASVVEQVDTHTLHQRLGHMSADAMRSLIRNNTVEGIQLLDNGSSIICDSCEYAKMTRKPIRSDGEAPPAQNFGDEILHQSPTSAVDASTSPLQTISLGTPESSRCPI